MAKNGTEDIVQVHISCLCGATAQDLPIPEEKLPFQKAFCHCDCCRFTSGLLCTSDVFLPHSANGSVDLKNLTAYQTSDDFIRYFCKTCGAYVFFYSPSKDEWEVTAGVLDVGGERFKIGDHIFVGDPKDGGMSIWLPAKGFQYEIKLPFWKGHRDKSEQLHVSQVDRSQHGREDQDSDRLTGKCHCGGIEYYITRPNDDSKACSSPYPDLLVPSHRASSANPQDEKWWLRANDTKYLAGLCTCKSCRLASGFPILSWAFIPKANIHLPDGSPLNYNNMTTLQQFQSSPGVYRDFCNKCGATVFLRYEDERPDLIDVSVGLLRAKSGARAEGWLDWQMNRVSFKEDAQDVELAEAVEFGLYEAHERKFS